MKFNFRLIFRLLGILILFNGLFMAICLPFSIYYKEETTLSILISSCITIFIGGILLLLIREREDRELKKRDGYLIVTFGWLAMSFTGTIPYIILVTTFSKKSKMERSERKRKASPYHTVSSKTH